MDKTEHFIKQARQIHGTRYDYSKVKYINVKTPVEIICKEHGSFLQSPNSHISKQSNCPACSKKRYITKETFINNANVLYEGTYDYSLITEYKNYDTKYKIICPYHGTFVKTARNHLLNKQGCPSCGKDRLRQLAKERCLTQEEFLQRAASVHGTTYDYSNAVYVKGRQKVEIICKEHGTFLQTPESHINKKQGCPTCGRLRSGGKGGYTDGYFSLYPDHCQVPAMLYIVEMTCASDNFIKVGITTKSLKQRYSRTRVGQKYINKQILHIKYMKLKEAYDLEQQILTNLKKYQYFPNYIMDGRTECLKNTPEVLSAIMKELNP